jgi:hypothetical protein
VISGFKPQLRIGPSRGLFSRDNGGFADSGLSDLPTLARLPDLRPSGRAAALALKHPRQVIKTDPRACPSRHDEPDPAPMRWGPARVRSPVWKDHVELSHVSLAIGVDAVVLDQDLGVGLRQPLCCSPALEPLEHAEIMRHTPARFRTAYGWKSRFLTFTRSALMGRTLCRRRDFVPRWNSRYQLFTA